ncbi:MAG: polyprenyl synthetase family protein [Candidatus Thermoplasmatota archaeon]|nr:polyprenyl synthetase family protein [Candidatus Thermoplasmatota archaeon]
MKEDKYADLEDFFNKTRSDLEKKIADTISDKDILSILKGGKRLRPVLAQLTFKSCTEGKESEKHYQRSLEGSVSIELAHTASLVHDDIIDGDVKRRGKKAYYVKVGTKRAILEGHKMLAKGFTIALDHGKEIADLYVNSWGNVISGEIDEVEFNKKDIKSSASLTKKQIFEIYDEIIYLKTAVLFSSACKAGAMEANMTGDILKVFGDYGREVGLAYQLADDLVDLKNGEMINSVILPILNRFEKGTILKGTIKKREIKKKFIKHQDEIKEFFTDEIRRHVKNAEEFINQSDLIPSSPYKTLLSDAPSYIINKMLEEINITI